MCVSTRSAYRYASSDNSGLCAQFHSMSVGRIYVDTAAKHGVDTGCALLAARSPRRVNGCSVTSTRRGLSTPTRDGRRSSSRRPPAHRGHTSDDDATRVCVDPSPREHGRRSGHTPSQQQRRASRRSPRISRRHTNANREASHSPRGPEGSALASSSAGACQRQPPSRQSQCRSHRWQPVNDGGEAAR